ncbi:hypothetical protein Shyd_92720 [Streptomyces hydrogenans]|uniref:Uncharacterized protein n=1 Tax=Streptomyces hydrogenans TaxID=1873719 RepID=A0ABQ3PSB1_9ACTN|nr:hypothetical protein GCM10018784_39270 [Streptomyces hydrogenans]GHI27901.1 hypothetical protein Shyd_92720 [Streptomyces hydrogenans]
MGWVPEPDAYGRKGQGTRGTIRGPRGPAPRPPGTPDGRARPRARTKANAMPVPHPPTPAGVTL